MTVSRPDRRRNDEGSLICDNGHLRLRIVRDGRSLGITLDARDLDDTWGTIALCTSGDDIHAADAEGIHHAGAFYSFDPLEIDGETRGVELFGTLGDARLTLTALLDDASTWLHVRLAVSGATCRRVSQQWRLRPDSLMPELCWPTTPVEGAALDFCPIALAQDDSLFAALIADLEDGVCGVPRLDVAVDDVTRFTYGVTACDANEEPLELTYLLGLDARALPERGFQQVARQLGSRESLTLIGPSPLTPSSAPAALGAPGTTNDWHPLVWEGTTAAIAAHVQDCLAQARAGNWQALEDGLCWLDRLCLHQSVAVAVDAPSFGAFGAGDEWTACQTWLPMLLMHAFRLTGIPEYGCRAQAALRALPDEAQSAALALLRPAFGDLYANADYGAFLQLSGPEVDTALFTPDGFALTIASDDATPTLRLVLDGSDDAYALSLNDRTVGMFPSATLSTGLDLPTRV